MVDLERWKPDGAPIQCGVKAEPKNKWPYVGKCERKVEYILPWEIFNKKEIQDEFGLKFRVVCQFHADNITQFYFQS